MTKDEYSLARNYLEQIEKLNILKNDVNHEYHKADDQDLKETLSKCNEALTVLKEINQEKFDKL